ncbi:uncharacterized protein LOC121874681 [Homarus americanus]|uniref:uncharacterized protein LOC121874681 n=1 Tax=Homarus americanus TaxID=6706 RepID=UPI001C444F6D|nr:uncharacterized protein LOC121874681 [Homarus americanus]
MRVNAVYIRHRHDRQAQSIFSLNSPNGKEFASSHDINSHETSFKEGCTDGEEAYDQQQQSARKMPRLEKDHIQPTGTSGMTMKITAPPRPTRAILQEVLNTFRSKLITPNTAFPIVPPSLPIAPLSFPVRKLFPLAQDKKKVPLCEDKLADKENISPVDSSIFTAVSMLEKTRKEFQLKQQVSQYPQTPSGVRCLAHTKLDDHPPAQTTRKCIGEDNTLRKDKKAESSNINTRNNKHAGTPIISDKEKKKRIPRRSRRDENSSGNVFVSRKHLTWFFQLVEDPVVRKFLKVDICRRYADKYLLAMVFTYLVRAGYKCDQYSKENFFAALYLAHDMEEDEEELKFEVFPWALGRKWRKTYPLLLQMRDDIFWAIDCRAVVSKRCCDQVIGMQPDHWMWDRERPTYHGGALRDYLKHPNDNGRPRGPDKSPLQCQTCLERECSTSENSYILYLSESDTSTDSLFADGGKTEMHMERDSGFETFLCQPSDTSLSTPQDPTNCAQYVDVVGKLGDTEQLGTRIKTNDSYIKVNVLTNGACSDSFAACNELEKNMEIPVSESEFVNAAELPLSQADTIFIS